MSTKIATKFDTIKRGLDAVQLASALRLIINQYSPIDHPNVGDDLLRDLVADLGVLTPNSSEVVSIDSNSNSK